MFEPGVEIEEALCFNSLAAECGVRSALVVGYEAEDWCRSNNRYLASIRSNHDWINPVAFVHNDRGFDLEQLDAWRREGFVGLSLYPFTAEDCQVLVRTPEECWQWLVAQRELTGRGMERVGARARAAPRASADRVASWPAAGMRRTAGRGHRACETDADRARIRGENLLALLADVTD
ncbi:MAG: hypothetical protein O2923_05250 [Verrucomicrobia bacterium]|nr:hypothetical protein [Verrucomicrobiota bacterium]MDA1087119.1 hypothetical protein [Verrucomicrobiota bacterium]